MLQDTDPDDHVNKPLRTDFEEALIELFAEKLGPSGIIKIAPSPRKGVVIEVEIDLAAFRSIYNQKRDPRAVFTQAYEKITKAVLLKMQNPKRGFVHRVWLAALDDTFAQYYFNAARAYNEARIKDAPELWNLVFEAIGVSESASAFPPRATTLEKLILPMLAHMMYDLPLAVAELAVEEAKFLAALAQGQSAEEAIRQVQITGFDCQEVAALRDAGTDIRLFQQYIGDYNRINEMLIEDDYEVIDAVQRTTIAYSPFLLNWLDRLAGRHDEILTHSAIQLMRGKAWYEATRLVEAKSGQECEKIRRSIEEDAKVLIKLFHDPSSRFRAFLLQFARALSGLFQTWPQGK